MTTASITPPSPGTAGIPAAPCHPRLADLMRLPPGRKRQDEITRIVAGLAASLAPLHAAGRVHGGIHPGAVAFDGGGPWDPIVGRAATGAATLTPPPVAPAPDAEDAPRHAGYAAFEQYTDDPAYACGPWTDVYGLAALAYFLATGSAPPSALARRVRDDCLPLEEWGANEYERAFCDAVDSGLAMTMHARPQTAQAFAAAIGTPPLRTSPILPAALPTVATPAEVKTPPTAASPPEAPPTAAPPPAASQPEASPPEASPPEARTARELPRERARVLPWILACALLLAGSGYAWVRMTSTPVELAGTPEASARTLQASPAVTASAPAPAPAPTPDRAPAPQQPLATAPEPPQASQSTRATQASQGSSPVPATQPSQASQPTPATPSARVEAASSGGAPAPVSDGSASNIDAASASASASESAPAPAPAPAPVSTAPPKAAPVSVRVAVRPWGEVLINGRSRGVSPPLRELSLTPGRYQVTVRNATAGEHRMTLTVAADKPAAISHEFK